MTNMHSAAVSGAQKKHIWACQLPLLHSHYLAIHHVELYAKFSESLWALLPHVGKPLIINRASRSHARKVLSLLIEIYQFSNKILPLSENPRFFGVV